MLYYDDQDENRSMMSYPDIKTKKKMKFRGAAMVSGVFGKVRNSSNKMQISHSTSSESLGLLYPTKLSYSTEWKSASLHPQFSQGSKSFLNR